MNTEFNIDLTDLHLSGAADSSLADTIEARVTALFSLGVTLPGIEEVVRQMAEDATGLRLDAYVVPMDEDGIVYIAVSPLPVSAV